MTETEPDLAAPSTDPAAYAQPRRGLPVTFWLLMIFGLACVLAGGAVATFGPRLLPKAMLKPTAAAPAHRPAPAPLPRSEARTLPPAVNEIDAATPEAARLGAMADRLDQVEAAQNRLNRAAAGAIAAASLAQTASGSRAFGQELEALAPLLPGSDQVRALRPLAAQGAPTRQALAQAFPDVASRAALAARARAQGTGLVAQIAQAFAAIVTIRRVDRLTGDDADAVLARAQRAVDNGDLAAAVAQVDALPPAGREAAAPWRAQALRRLELDRRVDAVRTAALGELARLSKPGAVP